MCEEFVEVSNNLVAYLKPQTKLQEKSFQNFSILGKDKSRTYESRWTRFGVILFYFFYYRLGKLIHVRTVGDDTAPSFCQSVSENPASSFWMLRCDI